MSKRIRLYELYPHRGSFSVMTIHCHQRYLVVAATSVRQAYALAHKGIWIDPDADAPVGIMLTYTAEEGTTLWCGCRGHNVGVGLPLDHHGGGVTAVRAAVTAHRRRCLSTAAGEMR